VNLESRYFRNPEVAARRVAEETILERFSRRAGERVFFTLNEVGTFVWERLDGLRSLSSITEEILAIFAVETPRAVADVLEFVDQLEQVGCVLEVGPLSFDVGRRSTLRNDEGHPASQPVAVGSRRGIHRTQHAPQSPLCPRPLRN
jgi:hypothetical protein